LEIKTPVQAKLRIIGRDVYEVLTLRKVMKRIIMMVVALGLLVPSVCFSDSKEKIKPGQRVRFPKSEIACLSRDALEAVVVHSMEGETEKIGPYMASKDNPTGECTRLDSKQIFKVLRADYNDPANPDWVLMEVVGENAKSASKGAWVVIMGEGLVEVMK
jgi:hypothetical protein